MELGAFSVSLAVADIEASRVFYAKFGFEVVGGDAAEHWLILRNGTTTIGLFQGMFEQNISHLQSGVGRPGASRWSRSLTCASCSGCSRRRAWSS